MGAKNCPKKKREWDLKTKYGMTPAEYDAMLDEQGGVCAICSGPPAGRWKRLAVDHDHDTGAVRGLLCWPCNTMLGMSQDSAERLRGAANYLERAV